MKVNNKALFTLVIVALIATLAFSYSITFDSPTVTFEGITTFRFTTSDALVKNDVVYYGSSIDQSGTNCVSFKESPDAEDFLTNDDYLCVVDGTTKAIAEVIIEDDDDEKDCKTLVTGYNKSFQVEFTDDVAANSVIVCTVKIAKTANLSESALFYTTEFKDQDVDDEAAPAQAGTFPKVVATTVTDESLSEKDGVYSLTFKTNRVGPLKIIPSCWNEKDKKGCQLAANDIYCTDNSARLFNLKNEKSYVYSKVADKKITCKFYFTNVEPNVDNNTSPKVSIAFDDVKDKKTGEVKLVTYSGQLSSAVSTVVNQFDIIDGFWSRTINFRFYTPSETISKGNVYRLSFESKDDEKMTAEAFVASLKVDPSDSDYTVSLLASKDGFQITYNEARPPLDSISYLTFTSDYKFENSRPVDFTVFLTTTGGTKFSDLKKGLNLPIRAAFDLDSFKAEVVGTEKNVLKMTAEWKPLYLNVESEWFVMFALDYNVNKKSGTTCSVEIEKERVKSSLEYNYGHIIVSSKVEVDEGQKVVVVCQTPFEATLVDDDKVRVYAVGEIVGNVYTASHQFQNLKYVTVPATKSKEDIEGSVFTVEFPVRVDLSEKRDIIDRIIDFFTGSDNIVTDIEDSLDDFVKAFNAAVPGKTITVSELAFIDSNISNDFKDLNAPFTTGKTYINQVAPFQVTLTLGISSSLTEAQKNALEALNPPAKEYVSADLTADKYFYVKNVDENKKFSSACTGTKNIGTAGCAQQLPGGKCTHHSQCLDGICYDGKCRYDGNYAPFANSVTSITTTMAMVLMAAVIMFVF